MGKNKLQNVFLISFFFSLNFEIWDPLNTDGNFSISKLTGILYAMTMVPKINYLTYTLKYFSNSIRILFLFYILLVILNLINISPYGSDVFMFSFFQNIILFWILLTHERLNPGIIEKGFISFALGSLVLAAFYFIDWGREIGYDGRISMFGDNENIIGIRMVIGCYINTHLLFNYRYKIPIVIYGLLPFVYIPLIVLLVSTGSRVSFISLMAGMFLFFILLRNRALFGNLFFIIVGFTVSYFIYNFAMQSEVLSARLLSTTEEGNLAGRDEIWKSILPLIEENWLYGVGSTGYADYSVRFFNSIRSPHNVIIEVLAYSGVIGLIMFLSFVFISLRASFKYYKISNHLFPLFFFIPVVGLLLSGQILFLKLAWTIFAYGVSRELYLIKSIGK